MEIVETKWIIMDKTRKVIAKGVPRSRRLVFVDGPSKARLLTYNSRAKVMSNGLKSGFYHWDVDEYMSEQYGEDWHRRRRECLEPVEVEITTRIVG